MAKISTMLPRGRSRNFKGGGGRGNFLQKKKGGGGGGGGGGHLLRDICIENEQKSSQRVGGPGGGGGGQAPWTPPGSAPAIENTKQNTLQWNLSNQDFPLYSGQVCTEEKSIGNRFFHLYCFFVCVCLFRGILLVIVT